ncbi:hypothetical protein E2C01_061883 [Portunus trituberculatus]|uniref:Uncharacterized protein n=1 Tax=Portunus trituberculatus TaxID=210409 RepID=A0A5B7HC68_PORTR|nr:hypothetical protein [Portunus trituberculatus]
MPCGAGVWCRCVGSGRGGRTAAITFTYGAGGLVGGERREGGREATDLGVHDEEKREGEGKMSGIELGPRKVEGTRSSLTAEEEVAWEAEAALVVVEGGTYNRLAWLSGAPPAGTQEATSGEFHILPSGEEA